MAYRTLFLLLFSLLTPLLQAASNDLEVLTCEPEWAALAKALGGDTLKIASATTYMQDPHHIQARPSLIARARKADLLICTGAGLEVGWLPLLMRKSGNANIQQGRAGHFMATEQVQLLEQRTRVDRSEGDVHGAGNPHIHLDPRRMLQVADQLTIVLGKLLPGRAEEFEQNLETFKAALNHNLEQHADVAEKLRGEMVAVHHNSWVYLQDWLGLKKIAELEPKPGLPPSSSHLAELVQQLQQQPAAAIIYASYQDSAPATWLSGRTGIPAVKLPYSVKDWRSPDALVVFYGQLVELLAHTMNNSAGR